MAELEGNLLGTKQCLAQSNLQWYTVFQWQSHLTYPPVYILLVLRTEEQGEVVSYKRDGMDVHMIVAMLAWDQYSLCIATMNDMDIQCRDMYLIAVACMFIVCFDYNLYFDYPSLPNL